MENILLKVPDSTAKKWQQASERLKKQAVEAVKRVLDAPNVAELAEEEREVRLQEIRKSFSRFNTDLSNYKFDRDEANER